MQTKNKENAKLRPQITPSMSNLNILLAPTQLLNRTLRLTFGLMPDVSPPYGPDCFLISRTWPFRLTSLFLCLSWKELQKGKANVLPPWQSLDSLTGHAYTTTAMLCHLPCSSSAGSSSYSWNESTPCSSRSARVWIFLLRSVWQGTGFYNVVTRCTRWRLTWYEIVLLPSPSVSSSRCSTPGVLSYGKRYKQQHSIHQKRPYLLHGVAYQWNLRRVQSILGW